MLPSFEKSYCIRPRPRGFSLKNPFFKGKALGTRLLLYQHFFCHVTLFLYGIGGIGLSLLDRRLQVLFIPELGLTIAVNLDIINLKFSLLVSSFCNTTKINLLLYYFGSSYQHLISTDDYDVNRIPNRPFLSPEAPFSKVSFFNGPESCCCLYSRSWS